MVVSDVEPELNTGDPAELFTAYLDFYREAVARKIAGLTDDQLRASMLPSGWTPAELINHLAYMERRWFVWGFLGERVEQPWGDSGGDPDGRWTVGGDVTAAELIDALHAVGVRTRAIIATADLADHAAIGGRFSGDPPTLAWICFHVLQEYARHAGHLDASRELIDGTTGE